MTDLRSQLQGLWLPLVTPFRDGELDETSLRRLVRHYADGPVDGLILAATSGEGMTLGMAELERVVALVRDRDRRQRTLPADLPRAVGRQHAQDAGCAGRDGGLADRRLPDRKPLLHRGRRSAACCSISPRWPIMPRGRSCSTTFPTGPRSISTTRRCCELAEHPNIVGLKDCCADRAQSIDLLRRRPAGFRVLTGEDAQYYEALTDGADGAILLSAHIETETLRGGAHAVEGRQPRRRAGALAKHCRTHPPVVRRAEPGAGEVLAGADRADRRAPRCACRWWK